MGKLPFVLYEIFLGTMFKQPFAGRTAKIELSTVIGTVMPGSCYFYYHTTDGVYSGFGYSRCGVRNYKRL